MKIAVKLLLLIILQVNFLGAQIEVQTITAADVAGNQESINESWRLYSTIHAGMLSERVLEVQFNAAISDVELGKAFLLLAKNEGRCIASIFCNIWSLDFFPMITLGVFGFNDQQFDGATIDRAFSRMLNNLPNDGFSCGVCLNVTQKFADKYHARLTAVNFSKDNLIYKMAPYSGSVWYSLMWEKFPRL